MWPTETMHNELRLYRLSRTQQRGEVYYAIGRLGPARRVLIVKSLEGVVAQATVYRTIKAFLATQVIRELPGGLMELSAGFRHEHFFVLCRSCGLRTAFWDAKLESYLAKFMDRRNYVLPAYQVELSGLCQRCAQQI